MTKAPFFIMHRRENICRHCGNVERHSDLYQCEALANGQKLLPATAVGEFDAVHVIEIAPKLIPVCAMCVGERRGIGADLYAKWQETFRRKAAPDPHVPVRPTPTSKPKVATLDELA